MKPVSKAAYGTAFYGGLAGLAGFATATLPGPWFAIGLAFGVFLTGVVWGVFAFAIGTADPKAGMRGAATGIDTAIRVLKNLPEGAPLERAEVILRNLLHETEREAAIIAKRRAGKTRPKNHGPDEGR